MKKWAIGTRRTRKGREISGFCAIFTFGYFFYDEKIIV